MGFSSVGDKERADEHHDEAADPPPEEVCSVVLCPAVLDDGDEQDRGDHDEELDDHGEPVVIGNQRDRHQDGSEERKNNQVEVKCLHG